MDLLTALTGWMLWAYRRPRTFLVGCVILPLLLMLVFAYRFNATLWRRHLLDNLHVTSRLAAEIVDETRQETLRFETLLTAQPGFLDDVQQRNRQQLAQRLQAALGLVPRAEAALVTTLQGDVLASFPEPSDLTPQEVIEGDPFVGAQHNGWRPYISAVYLRDGDPPEKVVSIVLPLKVGDTPIGLLQVRHRIEDIKSWLQKIRVEPSGFLYVVDHHDQLVVFPLQILPGRPLVVSSWPPVAQPLTSEGTTLRFIDSKHHQRWLAGVYPVGTTGWRVVAVQPERAALGAFHQMFWSLAVLVIMLGVLVILVGMRWAQLHTFSLQMMRQNTKLLKQMHQRRIIDRPPDT